ncbi:MAG: hypothetical protein LBD80_00260 [Tannerella sp.]|jgi:hypothetical protein|nr:hypothetical protein [Tannerella sp.]
MGKDWVPKNHEELYDQAALSVMYLTAGNILRMGLSGFRPWLDGKFHPSYALFEAAFEAWKNPAERTMLKTATLYEAEKAFIPLYRQFYMGLLRDNPMASSSDLVAMGFPSSGKGERHEAEIPRTSPVATVKLPGPAIVEIHYRDGAKDGASRAKPHGIHGAEICWMVSKVVPVNWEQLVHSSFDTASPFRLVFGGEERGERLYFALRWENMRGGKGPWSEIQDAVIP